MNALIGTYSLTAAILLAVATLLVSLATVRFASETMRRTARRGIYLMTAMLTVASAALMHATVTGDFTLSYVVRYTEKALPLGYRIAGFWAGQEGSLLLWAWLLGVMASLWVFMARKDRSDTQALATGAMAVMIGLFCALMLFTVDEHGADKANPFATVGQIVFDGQGMNPMLQNPLMISHPPVLFVGYAGFTIPFALLIGVLLAGRADSDWLTVARPWVLVSWLFLGAGIILGAAWAYVELGWGGYWAWDPVENSSLVPWLISVAAIHTMVVQRKDQGKHPNRIGRYAVTNLILSMSIYILVLYSTFLTRSGVLGDASVHSFVDPGMIVYLFLISLIGSFAALGLIMIIYRWKTLSAANAEANSDESLLSRELSLFTAAVAMTASAIIVFTGTSAPIFGQSVDIVFYDDMHIPLAIIIMFLNGMSLLLKWKATKGQEMFKKLRWPAILSLAITAAVIIFGGVSNIMMILMTLSASFALIVNAEIAYKIFTGKPKMAGAYIAHMGIALFILGVVGSAGHSIEKDIDLPKGETVEVFGHKLTFTGYNGIENNKKFAFNVDVTKGDEKYTISPVMYISDFNQGLMREPDILMGLTKDLYISPLGFEEGGADHAEGNEVKLTVNEETRVQGLKIKYVEFVKPDMTAMMAGGDFVMGAKLSVEKDGKTFAMDALMRSTGGNVTFDVLEIPGTDLKIQLKKVDPATKNADFVVSGGSNDGHNHASGEVLSVTASIKPYVNLVWLGVLIMTAGFFFSMFRRLDESVPSGSSDN